MHEARIAIAQPGRASGYDSRNRVCEKQLN
jgi:hypothetical protein